MVPASGCPTAVRALCPQQRLCWNHERDTRLRSIWSLCKILNYTSECGSPRPSRAASRLNPPGQGGGSQRFFGEDTAIQITSSSLIYSFSFYPRNLENFFLSHLLSIEIGKVTLPRKKVSLEIVNCKAMLTAFPGDMNSEDEGDSLNRKVMSQ